LIFYKEKVSNRVLTCKLKYLLNAFFSLLHGTLFRIAENMVNALAEQVTTALTQFSSTTRLYELTIGDRNADVDVGGLLVEAFAADDAVNELGTRDVIALSTSAYVKPESLLGQPATLEISLANGTRTSFAGEISEVAMLGSDGGFARYRVRISPWLWRLGQVRNSRVWQDKSVIDIIDAVFDAYRPSARWRWSDETSSFMADTRPRSYCCQYRESDLDFVRRILAEEGLSWRFEQTDDGPSMVLFADSSRPSAVPEDPSSDMDGGIRYHGVSAVERQDTVQALIAQRSLHASLTTVLSYDYKAKQIAAAGSPSRIPGSRNLPTLEAYDVPGQYAYADSGEARHYADLQIEGKEARSQLWRGRSTVRTLRAGTRMAVTGTPRRGSAEAPAFAVLRVVSVGVNNLPPLAQHALAELFGPIPELLQEVPRENTPDDLSLAVEQAIKSGYANCFEAIPEDMPWRPQLPGSDGRTNPKPTAFGTQSAIVIGPDGSDEPSGGVDELYCDYLGRVRIRFHWQDSGDASCWVRVAQRSAGGGMGSQFLPRIGQEVLVQFLENDIDRPIIVGALYNGRGAHDHARSAQGNLAGGNSPVWHGASEDSAGHRNAAAQWGVRSKEFGGTGYNQLLFDDTDAQGCVQLKCTHAATELSLGHLIHAADNYRGSFRGLGIELRTDAYGAVRAGAGLLVSSYGINHTSSSRDPAGENAAGIGMVQQAVALAEALNSAAATHQAVALAAHLGAAKVNASVLDYEAAPLKAMLTSVSGMVDQTSLKPGQADAGSGGKLPHLRDPLIAVIAKDGFGASAGQSLQFSHGETVTLMSGHDTQFVTGGQMRVHTGQVIGVLGGAVKAGEHGTGLQMIAAKDAVDIQAQADELKVQARDEVNVISANAHIDWVAAKRISLSTAGGANITIEGGNITVQCPGKIMIQAGKKSFAGPAKVTYELPLLPRGSFALKTAYPFSL
jgi:type VI secretion system secreted protein VgrG